MGLLGFRSAAFGFKLPGCGLLLCSESCLLETEAVGTDLGLAAAESRVLVARMQSSSKTAAATSVTFQAFRLQDGWPPAVGVHVWQTSGPPSC